MNKNPSKELQHLTTMKGYRPHLDSVDDEADKSKYTYPIQYYQYKLNNVHRLATVPLHQPYTVASHCYHTGLIFMDLCGLLRITLNPTTLEWVFRHDLLESATGDLIYPAKNFNEKTKEAWDTLEKEIAQNNNVLQWYTDEQGADLMSSDRWNVFKCADLYELFLFCTDEYQLGNRHSGLLKVIDNCLTYIPTFGIEPVNEALNKWTCTHPWI